MSDPLLMGTASTPLGYLPLVAMSWQVQIRGPLYTAAVSQQFVNHGESPLEVTYIFPLPPRGALSSYRMVLGEREIRGELRRREAAQQEYEQAKAEGRTASLLEQERPDLFTLQVGNLAPGCGLTIHLELDGPLSFEGLEACFRIPLVAPKRYLPGLPFAGEQTGHGVDRDTDFVPDGSRLNPPVLLPGSPNPVHLQIEVEIAAEGLAMGEVSCSLHEVKSEKLPGGDYRVVLGPAERLNRDFVLRIPLERSLLNSHLMVRPEEENASFLLTVMAPPDPGCSEGRDVVVLLDRSGSMQGWNMIAARNAAARIVKGLLPQDRFALVVFDDRVECSPPYLQAANAVNKFLATTYLRGIEVRGGTEIFGAFLAARTLLRDSERERCLVLLTDGAVGDQDRLTAWAEAHPDLRIHALAIGEASSQGILDRLATLSGGTCHLVENGLPERLHKATRELQRSLSGPVLRDMRLKGAKLQRVSPEAWDVYPGQPTLFHGRFGELPSGPLKLEGSLPDGSPYTEEIPVQFVDTPAVTRVWARAHLLDLEDRWAADPVSLHELPALPDRLAEVPSAVSGLLNAGAQNCSGWMKRTRHYWRQKGWPLLGLAATVPALPLVVSLEGTAQMASLGERWWSGSNLEDVKQELSEDALSLLRLEEQIEQISLSYGVLCRFTAFVSVDRSGERVSGPLYRVTQPVEQVACGKPESVVQLTQFDQLAVEVGEDLLALLDPQKPSGLLERLLERVQAVREALAGELGFYFPAVRFRDAIPSAPKGWFLKSNFMRVGDSLVPDPPNPASTYLIKVKEEVVAQGSLMLGHLLAVGPEQALPELEGVAVEEPVYGLPSCWVEENKAEKAVQLGCVLFDPVSVLLSHLAEVVRSSS